MATALKPLPGIESRRVHTSRLLTHVLQRGNDDAIPLIFIHGNFSSATYFEALMLSTPETYRCIAVDLRGYGFTEDLTVDATRGARDWSDDLYALLNALNISQAHLIGWSAGAAAIMQFMLDHSSMVSSLALIAPVSPYGFGGSKDVQGTPCHEDFAGSGGGVVAPEIAQRLHNQDRTTDSALSPLTIIRQLFVKPPFQLSREEDMLASSLLQKVGDRRYPGDHITSPHWPYTSPGFWGPINAVSAKYLDVSGIVHLQNKPPILWIRGENDLIIADRSLSDPAVLGEMELIANWPGNTVYPAQPMVSQMRNVLKQYQKNRGTYREVAMKNVGHSPFLEKPDHTLSELLHLWESL